jgi:hypothetical protein
MLRVATSCYKTEQRTLPGGGVWTPKGRRHAALEVLGLSSVGRLLRRTSENSTYAYFIDGTSANRLSANFVVRFRFKRSQETLAVHPRFIAFCYRCTMRRTINFQVLTGR